MAHDINASTRLALGLALCLLPLSTCEGQTSEQPAAQLVRFLMDPDAAGPALRDRNGVRIAEKSRSVANALVALGARAVSEIEVGLDRIQREGERPVTDSSSRWLLFAYARIRGPAAWQRLRAMVDDPNLHALRGDLDRALAIGFDLTSYVSASRPVLSFGCCRLEEPRHALDGLMLAWLQGDRQLVEDQLGLTARLALASHLADQTWIELRRRMWGGAADPHSAVGFRFSGGGDWALPEETLRQEVQDRRRSVDLDSLPKNPEIRVNFVDVKGNTCGSGSVRFLLIPIASRWPLAKYVVVDPDVENLLRTISQCAPGKQ